jgi:hypothetical protein
MGVNYYFIMETNETQIHPIISDKKKYIKTVSAQTGMKIIDGELVHRNGAFSVIEEFILSLPEANYKYRFDVDEINTLVETPKGFKLKIQPHITFHAEDGSLLRFSPYKENGLEISRIQSSRIGSGMGTQLMNDFLKFVGALLGHVPLIYLECTGAVGWKETRVNYDISEQTRFFRKFGFRVKNGKKYPLWVDMVRPADPPFDETLPF